MLARLEEAGVRLEHAHSLPEVIEKLDMIYMTRIQHEHDTDADRRFFETFDPAQFTLTTDLLTQMKEYTPILHPFPRNQEIPFEIDSDPRAMYFRQARNGMWIRAALLAHLFDVDGKIGAHHQKHYGS